jgi:serine protease
MKNNIMSIAVTAGMLCATVPALAGGPSVGVVDVAATTSQIIVRLDRYEGPAGAIIGNRQLGRLAAAAGVALTPLRKMSGGARVLRLPDAMPVERVEELAERLAVLPEVDYAVPDRLMQPQLFTIISPAMTPNDPLFAQQWHYTDAVSGINLPAAWDITTGDANVHVAVIDTGILGNHEDLTGRWEGGYDFISTRFNARDGNGRDSDPSDEGDWFFGSSSSWHGSHVAGTIGASTNNQIGVAGIAFGSTIQPIRTLGRIGGFTSDIVDAMRWAAGLHVDGIPDNPNPAKVLNMSLGGGGACDIVYQSAVDDVVSAGSVIVVAAGNSGADAGDFSPASCDDVITVAAVGRSGDLASYSNYGSSVEISAPGGDIGDGVISTIDRGAKRPRGDDYAAYLGTSMATPHVAGVVALMFSVDPNLTPGQVLEILQDTARAFPVGSVCAADSEFCGAGILDAAAAVTAAGS